MRKVFVILLFFTLLCANEDVKKINQKAAEYQSKIDKIDDETKEMSERYRALIREIENTKLYNKQLRDLIASQDSESANIKIEISSIDATARSLLPLINKMVDSLEKFINIDTPFLKNERMARIERIKTVLTRADVTVAEKYRVVLEAYLIENEYGKTIESYLGSLDEKQVEFFRFGRVALFALTLDRSKAFRYDDTKSSFVPLEDSNTNELIKAIKVAKKETTPELITIRVKSPK